MKITCRKSYGSRGELTYAFCEAIEWWIWFISVCKFDSDESTTVCEDESLEIVDESDILLVGSFRDELKIVVCALLNESGL